MRNDRKAQSAFHAEVINKYTGQQFISNYYPINFIASDNFVFFNTLYKKNGTGLNLASKAATWLYGPMRNPMRNFRGKANSQALEAINFLESAAEVEYIRERDFLNRYAESDESIKKILEECESAGPDKYFKLINALNLALKGKKAFEAELKKEIERINTNLQIIRNDAEAAKKERYVSVTKEEAASGKQKLTSEEYAERNALNGTDSIADTVKNPYFNFDGKKIFDSMFKDSSDFSIIAKKIMIQYGSDILDTKRGKLGLNKRQAVILMKQLIQEAYTILTTQFHNELQKGKNEDSSQRQARIEKRLDQLMAHGGQMDKYFNNLLNHSNLGESLTSIADQNGIPVNTALMGELSHSAKTLRERLKVIWNAEKAAGKTTSTFYNWRRSKNLSKKDLEEFIYMMSNVDVKLFYTNEGMAAADFIQQGMDTYTGGKANAPTDIYAGLLVADFIYKEPDASKRQKALEYINQAQTNLRANRNDHLKKQRSITNKNDYIANNKELQQMMENEIAILKQLKDQLDSLGIKGTEILKYINIQDTVKGYASIETSKRKLFEGAAFGSNLHEQLNIINQMLADAQINQLDAEWLTFALINCGKGMIGSDNKHALEDYLSAYVGLLMFSDASIISNDIKDYMKSEIVSSVSNIHLYTLNDTYVPSSYILHETSVALNQFLHQIDIQTYGTQLELTTYTSPNADKVYPDASWSLESLAGPAWEKEGQYALEKTHLTMYFLANFSKLLQQLVKQLNK